VTSPLIDSLLSALIVNECRDITAPTDRLERASIRVEELLRSTGFPETSQLLKRYRDEIETARHELRNAAPIQEQPTDTKRKRRKAVA
jgi:hypothetical protein